MKSRLSSEAVETGWADLPPALINTCLDSTQDAVIVADMQQPNSPLCLVNKTFLRITGYSKNEIIGRNCRYLQGSDRNQPEVDLIRQAIAEERPLNITLRNYRKDGSLFYNNLTLTPIKDQHSVLTHYVGVVNDITHQHVSEEIIDKLSHVDNVSGLNNRRSFSSKIKSLLEEEKVPLLILKMDIVRFHDVNYGYGYDFGDSLIRAIAERLKETSAFAVGRMGANEFALAFWIKNRERADELAARTLNLAQEAYNLHGSRLSPRFAAGYVYGTSKGDGSDLIRQAGTALHRSKQSPSKEMSVFTNIDEREI